MDLGMVSQAEDRILGTGLVSWDGVVEPGTCLGSKERVSDLGQGLGSALDGRMVSPVGDNALELGTCLGLEDGVLGQGKALGPGNGSWGWEAVSLG